MPFWTERPDRPPFRCVLTLQDDPSAGPYYNTGLVYFGAHSSPNGIRPGGQETLYLSPQAIREMCGADGSPLRAYTADEDADRNAQLEAFETENAELNARLEEANARIAELEQHLSPDAMAEALVVRLDERYAKKAGRKPAGEAA